MSYSVHQNVFESLKGATHWSPRARHTLAVPEKSVEKQRLLCVCVCGGQLGLKIEGECV